MRQWFDAPSAACAETWAQSEKPRHTMSSLMNAYTAGTVQEPQLPKDRVPASVTATAFLKIHNFKPLSNYHTVGCLKSVKVLH